MKYDTEMVDKFVRQMSFSERTTEAVFEFLEKELGWLPPKTGRGKVALGEFANVCPTCNGNGLEHVLVAGPDGEPDYYECVEEILERQAWGGDDVATAAMAYIMRLKDAAGMRGSMSSDNGPQFVEFVADGYEDPDSPLDPEYPEYSRDV